MGNLLGRYKFLNTAKVVKRKTLFTFEPDFELVKKGLCGVCARPLKFMRSGKGAYCGRKRCPAVPKFYITSKKFVEIRNK